LTSVKSKKKTTQLTISISSELRDRIEKYVTENQQKYPNDSRFRSISAFYTYVMEKAMDSFDKGKNLDDFETFVDSEIKDFYEKISFNALIPYYEDAVITNRYTDPTFEKIPLFFLTLRRLYYSIMDPYDIKSINGLMDRLRNYLISNNLTKDIRLDLFTGGSATDLTGVFDESDAAEQVPLANDTSFGVGYAPFSDVEKIALEVYPPTTTFFGEPEDNEYLREAFIKGYELAQQDIKKNEKEDTYQ